MNFDFSEDQDMLRNEARKFLEGRCPIDKPRAVMDDAKRGYDAGLWQELVEQGWTALTIPEEHGGLGMTRTDLCALLAQDRTPQSQLTRALQGRGLHVQATGQGDVAIERAQALMITIQRVVRVIVPLPIRTEELDDVFGHGGTPSSRAS